MNKEKTLLNYQDKWEILCNKASKGYDKLSYAERVWVNIQGLIGTVDNGGIISFFYNYDADYYEETIEDLKILGQEKIVCLLEMCAKIFPNSIVPKTIEERNDIINNLPDDGSFDNMYEEINNKFYEYEKELEQILINYLIKNKIIE